MERGKKDDAPHPSTLIGKSHQNRWKNEREEKRREGEREIRRE